jgi:ArsR family transcriptional regulator, cadmium/lead-responsive transcriptional repressor
MSQDRPEPGRGGQQLAGEDDQLWEAVAEPSRRRVLELLLAHGEATPTMLAAGLPVTRQAVAKHLAVLVRAGLVEGRRQGREIRYTVRPERVGAAAQVMADTAAHMARAAAQWDQRLAAIKRLAEAQHEGRAAGLPGAGPMPAD